MEIICMKRRSLYWTNSSHCTIDANWLIVRPHSTVINRSWHTMRTVFSVENTSNDHLEPWLLQAFHPGPEKLTFRCYLLSCVIISTFGQWWVVTVCIRNITSKNRVLIYFFIHTFIPILDSLIQILLAKGWVPRSSLNPWNAGIFRKISPETSNDVIRHTKLIHTEALIIIILT